MEAAVVHCTKPSDKVLVLKVGKFGERFEKITKAYGCEVDVLETQNGTAVTPVLLEPKLKAGKFTAVFLQANETSTGAYNPVDALVPLIRKHQPDCFIVVDGISALCAHEMAMDKLGIDVLLSGSQKGFGVPPGLAFIAMSERAEKFQSQRPRFYFDLHKEGKEQTTGRTAWTPAISVMQSLHASLTVLSKVGAQNIAKHHARMTRAVRAAIANIHLEPFISAHFSHALTSITVPAGLDAALVLKNAKENFGCVISGGQDELKGKIFRFAHLGTINSLHILQGLAAFEFALHASKHKFRLGSGVTAAMESLATSDSNC